MVSATKWTNNRDRLSALLFNHFLLVISEIYFEEDFYFLVLTAVSLNIFRNDTHWTNHIRKVSLSLLCMYSTSLLLWERLKSNMIFTLITQQTRTSCFRKRSRDIMKFLQCYFKKKHCKTLFTFSNRTT